MSAPDVGPPGGSPASPSGEAPPFPVRDLYLFRQQALALSPTYDVYDREEQPVLHIVRPIMYGRTFLAMLAYLGTLAYFGLLALWGYRYHGAAPFLLVPMGMVAARAAGLLVEPYRHVYVFSDETREHLLLAILQERKLVILTAPYTLVDGDGLELARFSKNYLYDLVRKRWRVATSDGAPLADAWEDSIAKSIARRVVGPLYGVLRTNFVISSQGRKLGEFNRKLTIFDRYVLDMAQDPEGFLDRRVAVALGVLLDTGESR